ncbi:hypothetical protein [Paenibacillus sp. FJAT-26967]|uniref:hypothetical protein n=1 Tax=Paenibacillus sp. FJAT-26967 TaxID=1729690 RepID=UPI000837AB70|nr:hypothetical protein [Paenibacillus sp. FJAT-26967]
MNHEKSRCGKIIFADGQVEDARLFQEYKDGFKFHLAINTQIFCFEGIDYCDCMTKLLKKTNSTLLLEDALFIRTNQASLEKIIIEEKLFLSTDDLGEETLSFSLGCNYKGIHYNTAAVNDFSIALQDLRNQLQVEFHICAYCLRSDFKSDGGEDLRHSWFCFREVRELNPNKPWFQREDEFDEAIPNVDAFYWCPAFQYKFKIL